jgi:hypothetical protein
MELRISSKHRRIKYKNYILVVYNVSINSTDAILFFTIKFNCEKCDKEFNSKSHYNQHIGLIEKIHK